MKSQETWPERNLKGARVGGGEVGDGVAGNKLPEPGKLPGHEDVKPGPVDSLCLLCCCDHVRSSCGYPGCISSGVIATHSL